MKDGEQARKIDRLCASSNRQSDLDAGAALGQTANLIVLHANINHKKLQGTLWIVHKRGGRGHERHQVVLNKVKEGGNRGGCGQ